MANAPTLALATSGLYWNGTIISPDSTIYDTPVSSQHRHNISGWLPITIEDSASRWDMDDIVLLKQKFNQA